MKNIIKLTVKLCSVENTIITDPLFQVRKLTKSLVKHRFSLHNLLRYEYADGRKANCLFSKQKSENMYVILISNN